MEMIFAALTVIWILIDELYCWDSTFCFT
jgi:hypothetical protein